MATLPDNGAHRVGSLRHTGSDRPPTLELEKGWLRLLVSTDFRQKYPFRPLMRANWPPAYNHWTLLDFASNRNQNGCDRTRGAPQNKENACLRKCMIVVIASGAIVVSIRA